MFKASSAHLCISLLLLPSFVFAASTKINGVTYDGVPGKTTGSALAAGSGEAATSEQMLRLKKVFLFPSLDDLSGALAPKLDDKLVEVFNKNPRFELIRDPQVVRALSPDEQAYAKAAENQLVHREAARVTGADTTVLLHTKNVGDKTEMALQFRDATGTLIFVETGTVPGSSTMETRWALVEKLFKAMLARLPFEGAVTGRTASTLTIDLGIGTVRHGDEIEIARIVSVQKHPLLGTIVGTDYVRTGRARVTAVDKVLSFADVIEEIPGERIAAGQKVLQARAALVHRGSEPTSEPSEQPRRKREKVVKEERDEFEDRLKGDFDHKKARFGLVGGNLYYGSIGHQQTSVAGVEQQFAGSGIGGSLDGELWVTRNWIASVLLGFHGASLEGTTSVLGASSFRDVEAAVGYRIYPQAVGEGLTITGLLGYQILTFSFPASAALNVGGKRYAGPIARVDGDLNFMRGQKLVGGFGIQPAASITETGPSLGVPNHGTVICVHLGWSYALSDEFWLRVGLRYDAASGSYDNSATLADKRFAIGPGIYYSF